MTNASIVIGQTAGINYTGSESGNICLGQGVVGVVGENNTLHIGDTGGSITSAYIAGIAGVSVSNLNVVTIDTTTGQLGSQAAGSSLIGITDTASPFTTALGSGAATAVTSGTDNTAVGWDALNAVTTGIQNVALGKNALIHNTGSGNTALGAYAGRANFTGSNNVLIESE